MVETIFDPQTVILTGSAPQALARRLFEAMFPLLPSNAERPDRTIPRLQLGMVDPWAVALGAAAEPIRRAFDPSFSAILKEASRALRMQFICTTVPDSPNQDLPRVQRQNPTWIALA